MKVFTVLLVNKVMLCLKGFTV